MNKINDGGPAFPHQDSGDTGTRPGMSLLDYFAIRATEKDIASHTRGYNGHPITLDREQARYAFARSMLAAREATP